MTKASRNMGASVRARLLGLARERGDDFQLLLTRYANERLLYRLAASSHGSRFVLKGAALFSLWTRMPHRATRDLDLLGFGESGESHLRGVFAEVLALDVEDDGVLFDVDSLDVGPIREDQEYGGVRVKLDARVSSAKVRLQVDVGFGDVVTPQPIVVDFPALLHFPAPRLRAYPRETVVAEKLEAMVQLGLANSRMKDFYDIIVLSRMFEFDGDLLVRAIRATFTRRNTRWPEGPPVALTPEFAGDAAKVVQWKAFLKKSAATYIGDLASAIDAVSRFIARPLARAMADEPWEATWPPGGPWSC